VGPGFIRLRVRARGRDTRASSFSLPPPLPFPLLPEDATIRQLFSSQKERPHQKTNPNGTLKLPVSRTMRKYLLFKPPSV
jgi:hypothetical protein